MANENKFTVLLKSLGKEIKECILTKWIGCFIALIAVVLSIVQAITYSGVAQADFNGNAVVFSVLGAVLFLVLSLFRRTSPLAPIALFICDFIAMCSFISVIVDYFSTAFFDGFSFGKLLGLEVAYSFSTVSFVVSMLISAVAIYVPQNRKSKKKADSVQEGEEEKNEIEKA